MASNPRPISLRPPPELLARIDAAVPDSLQTNRSAWIIEACKQRLKEGDDPVAADLATMLAAARLAYLAGDLDGVRKALALPADSLAPELRAINDGRIVRGNALGTLEPGDHARSDCPYPAGCTGCVPLTISERNDEEVRCCNGGALPDQTYGYAAVPAGAVPVQRCDDCRRFGTDEAAAADLAARWGTTHGYADGGSDADSGEAFPGDWWVYVPTVQERAARGEPDAVARMEILAELEAGLDADGDIEGADYPPQPEGLPCAGAAIAIEVTAIAGGAMWRWKVDHPDLGGRPVEGSESLHSNIEGNARRLLAYRVGHSNFTLTMPRRPR